MATGYIRKITHEGQLIYPRTVTDAVVDTELGDKLSNVLPSMRARISRIEKILEDPIVSEIENQAIDEIINQNI